MSPDAQEELLIRLMDGQQLLRDQFRDIRRDVWVQAELVRRHDERQAGTEERIARGEESRAVERYEEADRQRRRDDWVDDALGNAFGLIDGLTAAMRAQGGAIAEQQQIIAEQSGMIRELTQGFGRLVRLVEHLSEAEQDRQRAERWVRWTAADHADKATSAGHRPDVAAPTDEVEAAFELGRLVGRDEVDPPKS